MFYWTMVEFSLKTKENLWHGSSSLEIVFENFNNNKKMKNPEIIELMRKNKNDMIKAGYNPVLYQSTFQGKYLVILAAEILNDSSCFRKTVLEAQFQTAGGANKLFEELQFLKLKSF